jgi:hypothetical protein
LVKDLCKSDSLAWHLLVVEKKADAAIYTLYLARVMLPARTMTLGYEIPWVAGRQGVLGHLPGQHHSRRRLQDNHNGWY